MVGETVDEIRGFRSVTREWCDDKKKECVIIKKGVRDCQKGGPLYRDPIYINRIPYT